MAQFHGEVGKIRSCQESEEFDLGGNGSSSGVDSLIKAAFEEPVELSEMVRITLVVGAGKAGRQKYDASLGKWVTASLKGIGYADDRSGSCDFASAGSFKNQHDTGRNLFFVHVFPRARQKVKEAASEVEMVDDGVGKQLNLEEMVVGAQIATLTRFLEQKCGRWILKKRLADLMRATRAKLAEAERKLTSREALDEAEQSLYDLGSLDDLDAKLNMVVSEMKKMVEEGRLTSGERDLAVQQMTDRLPKSSGQAKVSLEERIKKLQGRKGLPTAAEVFKPAHDAAMRDLHKLLAKLEPLAAQSRSGKLLSITDANKLAAAPDLEERIAALAAGSRGWFETDDELEERLVSLRAHLKASKAKALNAPAPKARGSDGWTTLGSQNKTSSRNKSSGSRAPARSGGGFSALSMDD